MIFNKNHLGHEFSKFTDTRYYNDFMCKKCKIRIQYEIDRYLSTYEKYFKVNNANILDELNLTCDEEIIKNIIE